MTDDEYRREQAEAERLMREIDYTISRIADVNAENAELEAQLRVSLVEVRTLADNCQSVGAAVHSDMSELSGYVGEEELTVKQVFQALGEATEQYFTFKSLSAASKNLTQYNEEYSARFSYYEKLRRIAIGYVIGLDTDMVSSETARKTVEKAYLQNTGYWLAYASSSVMLWASDEREAAQRALNRALSLNRSKACLFYLLINLRFNRIDTAKRWYLNYLEKADMNALGDEWQYLLQAYLFGAFGSDRSFEVAVSSQFRSMLAAVDVTNADFKGRFAENAKRFAENYAHKTACEYTYLGRTCSEYRDMLSLLSGAEKNSEIARFYDELSSQKAVEAKDLPQRIENVLYSLVNSYDEDELEVVKKIRYNEAVIAARGDVSAAEKSFSASEPHGGKSDLGGLLTRWAFADGASETDVSVRKFAISLMKMSMRVGFARYAEDYRSKEKSRYGFNIDGCWLECGENEYDSAAEELSRYYDKNRLANTVKDKQVLICAALIAASLLTVIVMFRFFSPAALTVAVLTGLTAGALLWRRLTDLKNRLSEKKRLGGLLLRHALDDLAQWRRDYKEADKKNADLLDAVNKF